MKKLVLTLFFISALISCEKTGDLKTSDVIPGGCNLDNKGSFTKGVTEEINKVTYSISNGNLDMFVGFNATCCGEYSTSSQIKADSIIIRINTVQIGMCDCICYYTYNFLFTGTGDNYNYKVTIDDYLTFTGKIKN